MKHVRVVVLLCVGVAAGIIATEAVRAVRAERPAQAKDEMSDTTVSQFTFRADPNLDTTAKREVVPRVRQDGYREDNFVFTFRERADAKKAATEAFDVAQARYIELRKD